MRLLRQSIVVSLIGIVGTNYSQQTHFENTIKYLALANVFGRTTWNMPIAIS